MKNLHIKAIAVLLFISITTTVKAGPDVTVNKQAIADVMAGKTNVAYAAWWGFNPADSTEALQSAINSGAAKVIVEKRDSPWIVNQIQLSSDQEIVFAKGVIILAKKGEFKGATDSLFSASLKKNIKLTGQGAIFRMRRADYEKAPYIKAEWRNGISLRSCTNVNISGLSIQETGGDGIYLGVAMRGVTNTNITIKNILCDRNYRQGISVISAEDLLIENTSFILTAGTAPMAGIDFEPNRSDERLVNCVLRNCVAQNNQGPGFLLYLPHLNRNSKPVSIRFENCRSKGKNRALSCTTRNNSPGSVRGSIEFENCIFDSSEQSPVAFLDKPSDACPVLLKNCTIIGPRNQDKSKPVISFTARAGVVGKIGGVTFKECIIKSPGAHPIMSFYNESYFASVDNITGTLRVEHEENTLNYKLNKDLINKWMPSSISGNIFPDKTDLTSLVPLNANASINSSQRRLVRQRAFSRFLLYAKKGENVSTQFSFHQLVNYKGDKMPVTVETPAGKTLQVIDVLFKKSGTCTFIAPETGIYLLSCDPGANFVTVDSSSHRVCLTSAGGPVRLMAATGEFYFWVPPGVKKWAVSVFGGGSGENVSATLYDASGKKVWREQNVEKPKLYTGINTDRLQGGLWRLVLDRPTEGAFEDHYVQLIGVPSVISLTPTDMLIPKEESPKTED